MVPLSSYFWSVVVNPGLMIFPCVWTSLDVKLVTSLQSMVETQAAFSLLLGQSLEEGNIDRVGFHLSYEPLRNFSALFGEDSEGVLNWKLRNKLRNADNLTVHFLCI